MNAARFALALVFAFSLPAKAATAAEPAPVLHPKGTALPFSHQGPFVTTASGSILAFDSQNALHSPDEGLTWTTTPLFKDPKKYKTSNERALLRTRDGVVIAGWMNLAEIHSLPGFKWGGPKEEFDAYILPTYVCRSLDDGQTWEEPIKLNTPWCGCIHSMIETKSGRIVLVGQEIIPEWRHATVMFVSDDKGKTWQRSNVLDIGQGRHDHAGSCEATVVELKDGSLYELLRTETGYLYEATSSNGGLRWENFKQSNIKSVTCCAQMMRLMDGRIALLWNAPPRHKPDSPSSRQELSIALSADDAHSWSAPIVVAASYEPRGRASYPYLYERHPGELWITTMQGGLRMKINAADLSKEEIPKFTPPVIPPPKPGGIIMFGDSTTAERPGAVDKVYSKRIDEALEKTGSRFSVYNAGIGGNTTRDALKRLDRDVLAHKPKIVVMQFGINDSAIDVWKKPPATASRVPLAEFASNLRSMVAQTQKAGAKVILMTANPLRWTSRLKEMYGHAPYLPDQEDGFEYPTLLPYNAAVRKLAEELNLPLVDVHAAYAPFAASNKKSVDQILLDGMHPGDLGHQLVAEMLLPVIKAQ